MNLTQQQKDKITFIIRTLDDAFVLRGGYSVYLLSNTAYGDIIDIITHGQMTDEWLNALAEEEPEDLNVFSVWEDVEYPKENAEPLFVVTLQNVLDATVIDGNELTLGDDGLELYNKPAPMNIQMPVL